MSLHQGQCQIGQTDQSSPNLPRLLLALSSEKGKTNGNDNDKNNPTDSQGLTGHSISDENHHPHVGHLPGTLSNLFPHLVHLCMPQFTVVKSVRWRNIAITLMEGSNRYGLIQPKTVFP